VSSSFFFLLLLLLLLVPSLSPPPPTAELLEDCSKIQPGDPVLLPPHESAADAVSAGTEGQRKAFAEAQQLVRGRQSIEQRLDLAQINVTAATLRQRAAAQADGPGGNMDTIGSGCTNDTNGDADENVM
jgi:hypothetical protein